ncbi:MAG: pyrimidine 5'-nucleotidase [Alphaproteobacteria bacterium]|nr:pyrimidine 5'-nucleotidase [Alphaproteobacteria bacterium]
MPDKPASSNVAAALAHVDTWVFDLDNTLYPATCDLFHQIDRRMGEYIAGMLGLDATAARKIQKDYFRTYGTTLRGLMVNHGVDPRAYLDFVHDIDLAVMDPAPLLDAALAGIEGRKVIFTNASRAHAEAVIRRLGIDRHFDAIFDIHDALYVPKPEEETYDRFIAAHGIVPAGTVLFEDTAANLAPAHARGMATVLIRPGEDGVDNDDAAPHVHHVADDLAAFLRSLARPARDG